MLEQMERGLDHPLMRGERFVLEIEDAGVYVATSAFMHGWIAEEVREQVEAKGYTARVVEVA